MNKTILTMSLLITFLLGCVTTQIAMQSERNFIVPPVKAGTNPQRWEYKCFHEHQSNAATIEVKSNRLGLKGWDMVSIGGAGGGMLDGHHVSICFKRALP